jgi:hypothetical protein
MRSEEFRETSTGGFFHPNGKPMLTIMELCPENPMLVTVIKEAK